MRSGAAAGWSRGTVVGLTAMVVIAAGKGTGFAMTEHDVVIAQVADFNLPSGGGRAELRLSNGLTYQIDPSDNRFAKWVEILTEEQAAGRAIYVECPQGQKSVRWLSRFWPEQIRKVASEPEGERLKVWIAGSPSIYHIKPGRAGYEERRKLLVASAESKKPILAVTSDLEILEVRWP